MCFILPSPAKVSKQDHDENKTGCTIQSIVLDASHWVQIRIHFYPSRPSRQMMAAPDASLVVIVWNSIILRNAELQQSICPFEHASLSPFTTTSSQSPWWCTVQSLALVLHNLRVHLQKWRALFNNCVIDCVLRHYEHWLTFLQRCSLYTGKCATTRVQSGPLCDPHSVDKLHCD